jgi:hypothetical protein
MRLLLMALGAGFLIAGMATAQNAMPTGMVFFVQDTSCPAGSVPVVEAEGRLPLATDKAANWGQVFGGPAFTGLNEPAHTHDVTLTINLLQKGIAGASSCCNGLGTKKGDHSGSFKMLPASSDLPFVSLLVCEAG